LLSKKQNPSPNTLVPYVVLILGILFLSISPLFVRWANAPGVVTSFYRMLTVTVVLGTLSLFRPRSGQTNQRNRKMWLIPVLGGLFSAVDHALWSTSIQNTVVANATLLNYIAPLWVSLVAIFILHERYANFFWLGLIAVLTGAWIATGARFGDFSSVSFLGEGFAILSSFFYAGYFILSQRAQNHTTVLDYLLISSAAAMLLLLIIIMISGLSIFGYSTETYQTFIIAGLFSQLGGYFCINYALRHLPAPVVSSLLVLQPVITALLAVRTEGERLSMLQVLGGLLVIGGVVIVKAAKLSEKENNNRKAEPA